MIIKEIKKQEKSYGIYEVTFIPNWFEKLLGFKEHTKEFKQADSYYSFGGGNVYIDKDGNELGNGNWIGNAIDQFKRKW